jgi:hypothetical protein
MPLCPQITNTPITVVQNADFTVSNVVPVVVANTQQVNVALTDAAAALAAANSAFTLASTSLQTSSNTIVNASNQLTAINGNGITVYAGSSPTSGARVVLNSAGIAGFNGAGSSTFAIDASNGNVSMTGALFTGGTISGGTLNIAGNAIIDATGKLTATGADITGTINSAAGNIGGFNIGANYLSTTAGTSSGYWISTSGDTSFRTINASGFQMVSAGAITLGGGTISGASTISATSTISTTGNMSADGTLIVTDDFTNTKAGSTVVANTPNAWLSSAGLLRRGTPSSQRYKENITDIANVPELDPKKLLQIPVRAFSYKANVLTPDDDRVGVLVPGLIAEEVDAVYPLGADYENGDVQNINDRAILVNLLALVQDLYKEIAILKGA